MLAVYYMRGMVCEILNNMKLLPVLLPVLSAAAQTWVPQNSGTTAGLRAVSAVNSKVVWAGGTGGAWLRTTDGGAVWKVATVPGAEDLDFRGVRAFDANTAYLLSSGAGAKSRVYKTVDGGAHWKLLFTNPDREGFLDAIAWWDSKHGMVAGDPVAGRVTFFTTRDGGEHWAREQGLPSLPEEGAFAASNSCLAVRGKGEAWFGTGGKGAGRVLHSKDAGRTWSVATAPVRQDAATAGIFSLAFRDGRYGIAVGGDYSKDAEARGNIAVTANGGRTWTTPEGAGPRGFRSAILWLADTRTWLVTGTSGSEISTDNGRTWRLFDSGAYNALSGVSGTAVWAVGPKGRIARLAR
jgi:photosystem II stability/assembly factor-like uncharacterized protein